MTISKMNISMSSDELRRWIYAKTEAINNLSISDVYLRTGEVCVIGKYYAKAWVGWTATVEPVRNVSDGKIGLCLSNLAVDKWWASAGLSVISGLSSREEWVMGKVYSALSRFPFVSVGGTTLWVDVGTLASKYGVKFGGKLQDISIRQDGVQIEIQ